MSRLVRILLLTVCVTMAANLFASTYYIDYASGSDSANGTSKTAPWQHLPGMRGCAASCAATSPQPGDQFILKGGVTWPNANFPITWTWSGTSSNPIYIGMDKTWFSGASWNRPVFNAGGTAISGTYNLFVRMIGQTYVTLDNIEMLGLYWTDAGSYGALGYIALSGSSNITLNHLYLHDWTHATGGGTTDSNCMIVLGDTNPPYEAGSVFENGVVQNSDGDNDSCYGFYAWSNLENSVIHDLPNGALFHSASPKVISGNLVYNITTSFGGSHENAFETTGTGTAYFYDNVIHDVIAESLMIGNTNETDYVWNNVFYNLSNSNAPEFPQNSGQTGMSLYFWNNTVVTGTANNCFEWVGGFGGTFDTVAIQNNHCITTGIVNNTGFTVTNYTSNYNVLQTPAAATAQGYTAAQAYAYSPTSGGSTIGAGTNLTSSWPGGYATSDTNYACTQQTVGGVVESVCPARSVLPRPTSGVWDVGAYTLVGGKQPNPPVNLNAVPH